MSNLSNQNQQVSSVHKDHRKRVFEKLDKFGFEAFNDHELLEMILFFSIPRKDTNEYAHLLLERFKSISRILDASESELKEFSFVTDRTVQLFSVMKHTFNLYKNEKIKEKSYLSTTDEIATYFQLFFASVKNERLALMSLNNKGKLIDCRFIAEGDISSVGVSVRVVIERLIASKATVAVLCHNHPGGIALPSSADVYITKELSTALKSINVVLKDHIILSNDDDYVSMALSNEYKEIFGN